MTRLADRMLAGCQPARYSLIVGRESFEMTIRGVYPKATDDWLRDEIAGILALESISSEKFQPSDFQNAPIIVANDVLRYFDSITSQSKRIEIGDVVSSLAPPFDKFFIEFQHVRTPKRDLHSWGVLIQIFPGPYSPSPEWGNPRWLLTLDLFMEREKGKPFGPVSQHLVALAEDGTLLRRADGKPYFRALLDKGLLRDDARFPRGGTEFFMPNLTALVLGPALLTISFMH